MFERSNRELLQGAMDELPINFREISFYVRWRRMSYQEIAENTFRSYRHSDVSIIACAAGLGAQAARSRCKIGTAGIAKDK